jgi:hypothetical protein
MPLSCQPACLDRVPCGARALRCAISNLSNHKHVPANTGCPIIFGAANTPQAFGRGSDVLEELDLIEHELSATSQQLRVRRCVRCFLCDFYTLGVGRFWDAWRDIKGVVVVRLRMTLCSAPE